jgi:hypothetical protein
MPLLAWDLTRFHYYNISPAGLKRSEALTISTENFNSYLSLFPGMPILNM